jgi:lantibiotic biosynthesis protein
MKTWEPILDGPLAEECWQSVAEIAEALLKPVPPRYEGDTGDHPSLASGRAGQALFYAYRTRGGRTEASDQERAGNLLDSATDALAATPLPPDLYGGFAGVAWTAQHLYSDRFADADDEAADAAPEPAAAAAAQDAAADDEAGDGDDPLGEIDGALTSFLEHTPWTGDYDLIRGLSGFGVYLLERLPRASALACVERLVDRLDETARHKPEGVTWHTSPDLLPDWQREIYKDGYYNLGLAHGVPGAIGTLSAIAAATGRMAAAGVAAGAPREQARLAERAAVVARRARDLTGGAVSWLLQQRLPAGEESWFGTALADGVESRRSRVAWCYGDPGIAAALLVAARACGEPAWEKFATDMVLDAAARPADQAGVRDAGLCHGAAGLAHLFNRFYQETGQPRLREVSRFWFERTLAHRRPGKGVAGYQSFEMPDATSEPNWRDDPGFLEGATGIGLALLGGLCSFEPAWDRVMLLSAVTDPLVAG